MWCSAQTTVVASTNFILPYKRLTNRKCKDTPYVVDDSGGVVAAVVDRLLWRFCYHQLHSYSTLRSNHCFCAQPLQAPPRVNPRTSRDGQVLTLFFRLALRSNLLRHHRFQPLCQNSDYCRFLFVLVSCDFVDRLLRPTKERSTKLHELTLTKPHGTLEF